MAGAIPVAAPHLDCTPSCLPGLVAAAGDPADPCASVPSHVAASLWSSGAFSAHHCPSGSGSQRGPQRVSPLKRGLADQPFLNPDEDAASSFLCFSSATVVRGPGHRGVSVVLPRVPRAHRVPCHCPQCAGMAVHWPLGLGSWPGSGNEWRGCWGDSDVSVMVSRLPWGHRA